MIILIIGIFILGSVFAVSQSAAMITAGKQRAYILIRIALTAIESGLPLAKVFTEACRSENNTKLKRRMQHMLIHLNDGQPLSSALESVRELPERDRRLIEAAELQGQLEVGLQRTLARLEKASEVTANRPLVSFILFYPLILLSFIISLFTFLLLFVMPSLYRLAEDHGVEDITLLKNLDLLQDWINYNVWGGLISSFFLLAGPLMLLSIGAIQGFRILAAGRLAKSIIVVLFDRIAWYLPGLRRPIRAGVFSDTFFILAICTADGKPLHDSIDLAADIQPGPFAESRLRQWAINVMTGQPLDQSALAAGVPASSAAMLTTASATGQLPQLFEYLAKRFEQQALLDWTRLQITLGTILLICAACIVGLTGYGMIRFIVELINATIEMI